MFDGSARVTPAGAYSGWTSSVFSGNRITRAVRLQDNGSNGGLRCIRKRSTGRFYWELKILNISGGSVPLPGVARDTLDIGGSPNGTTDAVYYYAGDGSIRHNGAQVTGLATCTTNDVIGAQVDIEGRTIQFYKNGVALNGSPYDYSAMTAGPVCLSIWHDGGSANESLANFAREDWVYGPADSTYTVWEQ
jgi:hypothetical protein